MKKYLTQNKLKNNTLADIFIFILEKKQTTRREIECETGFSWGTVSANVAGLIEKGYVQEEKSEQSGLVGRTTCLLKPASDGIVSLGLDVNRSGLSCEIVALDSHVVSKLDAPFNAKTQAEVLAQAEALCQTAMDRCRQNALRVCSLGIAMQGAVNGRLGDSLRFPGIPDWRPCNIKAYFAEKFSLPVYLGHDPKCMLLGEMSRRKQDDCVLIRVDDGIGMSVSLDGKILDDTERMELGHTLAVPGGRLCSCGRRGCLEAYASLPALTQKAATDTLFTDPESFRPQITDACRYLSAAVYNVYTLFKPKRLILTGKAAGLACFADGALSLVRGEDTEITINPEISAAYGAAVESLRSAVKAFMIGKDIL